MNQPSPDRWTRYWSSCLHVVRIVLLLWFTISLGCGILLRDYLDTYLPSVGGAPFGFWMAQQGAIIGFLILLVVYMIMMNRLDEKFGFNDGDDE